MIELRATKTFNGIIHEWINNEEPEHTLYIDFNQQKNTTMSLNENRRDNIVLNVDNMLNDINTKRQRIEELEVEVTALKCANTAFRVENSALRSNGAESQIAKLKEELTFAQKCNCSLSDENKRLKAPKPSSSKSIHFSTGSYGELKSPGMPVFRSSMVHTTHGIFYDASSGIASALMNQLEFLIQKSSSADELSDLFTHILRSMK